MVIVKLQGGLGNQMFQYAVARAAMRKGGKIIVDTNFLDQNTLDSDYFTPRTSELHIFENLKVRSAGTFINRLLHNKNFVYRALKKVTLMFLIKPVRQSENEFVDKIAPSFRILYLDGYFQSEKYFKHLRSDLLHEFKFPKVDIRTQEIKEQILSKANPVCLHVRRGDYLKPKVVEYMGTIPMSYYIKAVREIEDKVSDPYYFIFSDDPQYCHEAFSFLGTNSTLITGNSSMDSWQDMYLMTKCKHHIIANSSFSWWGAWLSLNVGIKMAPKEWFNSKVATYKINDFVPHFWQIIDYD